MTKIGTLIEGALQGYLVDKASYDSGIHNLNDSKDPAIAAKFDANGDGKADLAGCVPGWGCERVIEHREGFAVGSIRVAARNGFLEANPAAEKLFDVAKVDVNNISAENKLIADGEDNSEDIDRHVDEWIETDRAEYDGWLDAARKAVASR